MNDDYSWLTVHDFPNKRRLGTTDDGGYVFAELDGKYDCYISAGVSNEESFSRDFIKLYNMNEYNSFAFDGTIKGYPYEYTKNITFINKNIARDNSDTTTNLHHLLERFNNIFLKMDIEGHEINWIGCLKDHHLANIKQLTIEFHGIHDNSWGYNKQQKIECFRRLAQTHYLVHVHGNNWGSISINGMPDVIECTYINKNWFSSPPAVNTTQLPLKDLDFRNNRNVPEINLNYEPIVHGVGEYKRPKIYVSFTTIPSRIGNIGKTVEAMLNQTVKPDGIYATIPKSYKRFPDVDIDITPLASLPVTVIRCEEDYGPICKILPVLDHISDPDAVIITIDDDHLYNPGLIQNMMAFHKACPNGALAYAGWNWNFNNGFEYNLVYPQQWINYMRAAHILEGWRGVLYKRSHFGDDFKSFATEYADGFLVDDVVISAYLASKEISRTVIPTFATNTNNSSFNSSSSPDSLSHIGNFKEYNKNAVLYYTTKRIF
jgi:hypothetical protein